MKQAIHLNIYSILMLGVLFVGGLILLTGCSRKVYPSDTEASVSRQWCFPLPGAKVISPYGQRGGRQHTGVDLKTKAKDKIYAAFDGEVVFSGKFSGYGNLVRIKHANGLETYYGHNSKNMVKAGQRVKAGQVIALVGQTGRATTPHLHFETRMNGKPQNPANYFNLTNHTLRKR
jgi:murein DD-endopeptidase MepM/ murein hydrolase activator NlpD